MIQGSIVALITPFNEDNSINFNKLYELIEYQYICGTDALLILGTTSECSTLSEYEKDRLVEYVVNLNNKRMKIIVGVISNVTQIAIEKATKYEKLGADCILVTPPYYNKTNTSGLIKHFKLIAYNVKIPTILYNIPSRTGLNIDKDVIKLTREGWKEVAESIKEGGYDTLKKLYENLDRITNGGVANNLIKISFISICSFNE